MKLIEISDYLNGELQGNHDKEINNVGKIESAGEDEISFISNPLYEKYYSSTNAGALILSKEFEIKNVRNDISIIRVQDPYLAFVSLVELFSKDEPFNETGVSDLCSIGNDVKLGENVFISDFVKIESNCKIGNDVKIFSNCSVGKNVEIGDNTMIKANVTIYKGCKIGKNVIIHSGTVIGSDGFGFAHQKDGTFKKIPQNGIVIIEDNVEIGSNCCIDRATLGETRICNNVKIDNQVQIAHNVVIGENTVIVSQVGIAGSTKIGKRCMIGGQAGIVGHLTICDDVIIGAAVGVSKSIIKPGIYAGYRAKPIKDELKQEAYIRNIEKLKEKINNLEKKK
jgi:UDP-3-O-[3-hydroxymyristoyl] glucosamine N-acyltransferase